MLLEDDKEVHTTEENNKDSKEETISLTEDSNEQDKIQRNHKIKNGIMQTKCLLRHWNR